MAVAALDSGIINRFSTVYCNGVYTYYDDYRPKCTRHGHSGNIDVITAIKWSCNIFFYDVGRRTTSDVYDAYAYKMGLGTRTGVSLYEAAQLDGASSTTMFWRITIPLIRPLLVYTLITSLIGGLQMFDVPQVLTNGKGDPNGSTNTIIMYLNQHLYSKNYGTAGAISVLMFLLCAVLCIIIYFTLTQEDDGLTREKRKAEKARIKAAKAAARHH